MLETLDQADRQLVTLLQTEFPLIEEPYAGLAILSGLAVDEVLARTRRLSDDGIIRDIGPVIDARALGYCSTLAAMKVSEDRLDIVARVLGSHPSVSHGYLRDHYINLWFTLTMPDAAGVANELKRLADVFAADATLNLPATKVFKIKAFFDVSGADDEEEQSSGVIRFHSEHQQFSDDERRVINSVQRSLPILTRPFDGMAEEAGMPAADFVAICKKLMDRGVIRRFGGMARHHRLGFTANGMSCWRAERERLDTAARLLIQYKQVTHCYERKSDPLWKYNLFAMIHSDSRDGCQEIADRVSEQAGLKSNVMLFSTREFKKARIRYAI